MNPIVFIVVYTPTYHVQSFTMFKMYDIFRKETTTGQLLLPAMVGGVLSGKNGKVIAPANGLEQLGSAKVAALKKPTHFICVECL